MAFFSLFSLILGNSFSTYSGTITVDNSQIVNGSTTTFVIPDISYSININDLAFGIGLFLVILIAMACAVGVTILGSGLSASSGKIVLTITAYTSLWGILSVLAYTLITSIEIYGSTIYIFLSIMYIVGVVQKISGGES